MANNQSEVLALCGGEATIDPYDGTGPINWLQKFSHDCVNWSNVSHSQMTSYHKAPAKNGVVASAFLVTELYKPDKMRIKKSVAWYKGGETRVVSPAFTRTQCLIERPDEDMNGKSVHLILRIKDPFVVWMK